MQPDWMTVKHLPLGQSEKRNERNERGDYGRLSFGPGPDALPNWSGCACRWTTLLLSLPAQPRAPHMWSA